MSAGIAAFLVTGSLTVAAWALLSCLRGRRFDDPLFYACAALEVALVAQLVAGLIALGRTARDVDGVTFVAYLVTAVLLPPAAVLWAASDRTRWGTAVVAAMGLTEAVLVVRLLDLWGAGGG